MIVPILHRVLVKQDKLEYKDETFKRAAALGIEISFGEKNREQMAIDSGVVVSVGPTAFKDFGAENSPIAVGDRVVYARYGGKIITDPSTKEDFVALNDEDVIAVLKD
jgi:co-chaperonin GroES (HSP10)